MSVQTGGERDAGSERRPARLEVLACVFTTRRRAMGHRRLRAKTGVAHSPQRD